MGFMKVNTSAESRPVVALMTDFGYGEDVGIMKGVVLSIVPGAQLVDITHSIAPQNVASGAWILSTAYRYFPKETVFVCVVDPGVGSQRRMAAVHAGDWYFVGPDNGLFSYILAEETVHRAVTLSNSAYHLSEVSSTFHGRDIFAPVAAHIARGVPLSELGDEIAVVDLQRLDIGLPVRQGGQIQAHVVHIDHFGNVLTSIPLRMVPELFTCSGVQLTFLEKDKSITERRRFFAEGVSDAGEQRPFIFGDSCGYVGVAIRNSNAAKALQVHNGAPLLLEIKN
jgi:S-adenosylmethionine hydrolase